MGKYINKNSKGESAPAYGKAAFLIADGAEIVESELKGVFQPNLVCVVNNGPFDAAAYAYSEGEMEAFNDSGDYRPKTWLIYPHAEKLAN